MNAQDASDHFQFVKSDHRQRISRSRPLLERYSTDRGDSMPSGWSMFTIPADQNTAFRDQFSGGADYQTMEVISKTRWRGGVNFTGNPGVCRCGPDNYNLDNNYSGLGVYTLNNNGWGGPNGIESAKMRIWAPFQGGVVGYYEADQPFGSLSNPMVLYDTEDLEPAAPYHELVCPIKTVASGHLGQVQMMVYFGVTASDIPTSIFQSSSVVPWEFEFPT